MKRVVVLGSTGSIGTQTLDICRQHPDRLEVVGLVANRSAETLLAQSREFGNCSAVLMDESAANAHGIPGGMSAVCDLVSRPDVDLVVVSVAGVIGLEPTLAAIMSRKDIALASKEVLVAAGEVVMPLVAEFGVTMTPIDSEHSALFQCLQGYSSDQVDSLILTASGGPFRGKKRSDLAGVTVKDALAHPTWAMGGKITIDSATLMNKGLEMIEARWLFGLEVSQVEVVLHPQSVIHSMVRFHDGSVLGQLGWPDMRLPIQYALLYPERKANELKRWNPVKTPILTFEEPDWETFAGLRLAKESAQTGGTMPAAFNAANEEVTNLFIDGGCSFLQIAEVVEEVMNRHEVVGAGLDAIYATDKWARGTVREILNIR